MSTIQNLGFGAHAALSVDGFCGPSPYVCSTRLPIESTFGTNRAGLVPAAYICAVEHRILNILAEHAQITRTDLFSKTRGAFPAVVQSRLITMDSPLKDPGQAQSGGVDREYCPELHPLNYEWYFTPTCAHELTEFVTVGHKQIACLGTPTVAAEICRTGQRPPHLIDSNPAIIQRFAYFRNTTSVHIGDIRSASELGLDVDLSILDPPWYLTDTLQWITVAAQITRVDGLIAFSLFPTLIRPTAKGEREKILDFVSGLGQVEVMEDALHYETPLFERETLRSVGIQDAGNWRRGDLVTVRVKRGEPKHLPYISSPKSTWETFIIAGQVLKLRARHRSSATGPLLLPIYGGESYTYPAISMRDQRRNQIDIWTSRNRVARVGDFSAVSKILRELENGTSLSKAIQLGCPHPQSADAVNLTEVSFRKLLSQD